LRPGVVIVAVLLLQFCGMATAQVLARGDYRAREEAISTRYVSARAKCAGLAGNPRAVCAAEASAQARTARAELEARDRPSAKARRRALDVAAQSRHAVALVRCDARARPARAACVAEADAARTSARAEAKTLMQRAQAKAVAGEELARERDDAAGGPNPERHEEARQQCGGYAGGGIKTLCMDQAGRRFGRRP
jgi:hypothetical protein